VAGYKNSGLIHVSKNEHATGMRDEHGTVAGEPLLIFFEDGGLQSNRNPQGDRRQHHPGQAVVPAREEREGGRHRKGCALGQPAEQSVETPPANGIGDWEQAGARPGHRQAANRICSSQNQRFFFT